jgi:hypothetical protein
MSACFFCRAGPRRASDRVTVTCCFIRESRSPLRAIVSKDLVTYKSRMQLNMQLVESRTQSADGIWQRLGPLHGRQELRQQRAQRRHCALQVGCTVTRAFNSPRCATVVRTSCHAVRALIPSACSLPVGYSFGRGSRAGRPVTPLQAWHFAPAAPFRSRPARNHGRIQARSGAAYAGTHYNTSSTAQHSMLQPTLSPNTCYATAAKTRPERRRLSLTRSISRGCDASPKALRASVS